MATLRFIGPEERWFETAVTGSQQSWLRGQSGFVADANVGAFLATGKFERYERDDAFLQNKQVVDKSGSPASGGGALVAAVSAICESYARSKDRNPRTNATIRSCELVSDTIYADSAALQTAFPAASNANKGGKVGTASSYVIQTSDGTSWTTPAAGVMGYLRTGVSATGYSTAINFLPDGQSGTGVPPDNGGFRRTRPMCMYGGFATAASGAASQGFFSKAGVRAATGTLRWQVSTDEPEPIIRLTGYSIPVIANLDMMDGSGFRAVVDPTIPAGGANLSGAGFMGSAGAGIIDVKLDLSQLGSFGRRRRVLQLVSPNDITFARMQIKPVSSWFEQDVSPRMLFVTDSLGNTVAQGNMKDAYPAVLQDVLGVPDIWTFTEGGTGLIADAGGAGRIHLDKIRNAAQIRQCADPAVVVIHTSGNDNSQSGIADAAETCIREALTLFPRAVVIVIGPPAGIAANDQINSTNTEVQVKIGFDRVVSDRLLWIPMMTDVVPYIRGTGTIDSPNGSGNSDLLFRNGDTIHWGTQGHLIMGRDFFAPKIVAALRAWIASQT